MPEMKTVLLKLMSWPRKKCHFGRYKKIKHLLKKEDRNLLDIGCGRPSDTLPEGCFLRYIGFGQGMDIEERTIPFPFTKGDIRDIPFENEMFGTVTSLEVLEHIEEPEKAIKEVHRVLKKNGCYIVSMPSNSVLWRMVWCLWQRFIPGMWNHTHISNYNKKEWIAFFKSSGLYRIEKINDYAGINLIIKMRKK